MTKKIRPFVSLELDLVVILISYIVLIKIEIVIIEAYKNHRKVLGSKTLCLNVLELQFVMLANHDQNVLVFVLDLLKVCFSVKLESSVLQDLLCKSAWLDRSRIRLDRSKLVQIVFL